MSKTMLLPVVGAIAGGLAVHVFLRAVDDAPVPADASTERVAEAQPIDHPTPAPAAERPSAGERLSAYETAARAADADDLESMIALAAAGLDARMRAAQLDALLARMAALDARRAVRLALALRLEARFLEPLFQTWAAEEPEAALAELRDVTRPAVRRRIALALLEALGNDARGVARVAGALPAAERSSFEIDALVARAERDPESSLQAILRIESTAARAQAISQAGAALARIDPRRALAQAAGIADFNLRTRYQASVLGTWAELDPAGVFQLLETATPREMAGATEAFEVLAAIDAARLFALGDRLPPANARLQARRAALQALAERDPLDALAKLDALSPGQERSILLQGIAATYARRSPEAALAWARSLAPPSEEALGAVLNGIAALDSRRAMDLLMGELENQIMTTGGPPTSLPMSAMMTLMRSSDADVSPLLDRLLDAGPRLQAGASFVIGAWGQNHPEAASDWAVANAERIDASSLVSLARASANHDVERALAVADRLPRQARDTWTAGVATSLAEADPAAAARLLAGADAAKSYVAGAHATVAAAWTQRYPLAAAEWALGLEEGVAQAGAVGSTALVWARADPDAARRWLLELPRGEARDAAINGYLLSTLRTGTADTLVLQAYSSDAARQEGASRAVLQLASSDPEQARALLEAYVTDSALRWRTEEQLRQIGSSRSISSMVTVP